MNGEFHLVNHAVNPSGQRITPMGGGNFKNFMAQAAMRSVSQSGSYGMCFRANDQALYIFQVRPSGEYRLYFLMGTEVDLVPWTRSPLLHRGGTLNLLQVSAPGSHITLYANGSKLASVEDARLSEGSIAVVAMEDGEAAASSLKVWKLP